MAWYDKRMGIGKGKRVGCLGEPCDGSVLIVACLALSITCMLLQPAGAQTPTEKPTPNLALFQQKAKEVHELLGNVTEATVTATFSPNFLKLAPLSITVGFLNDLNKELTGVKRVWVVQVVDAYECIIEVVGKNGIRVRGSMLVEAEAPSRLNHLRFSPNLPKETSGRWLKEVKELPDQVSLQVQRLGTDPKTIHSQNAEKPLAIGSSFKLLVLATLAEAIQKKELRWEQTLTLEEKWKSLPSGILQDWPAGSPITLHSLASLMISRSDNTAADHLVHLLGPARLQSMQQKLGIEGDRNLPILKTSELFRLKLKASPEILSKWKESKTATDRSRLLEEVRQLPLNNPTFPTTPRLIEEVEWWYSSKELTTLMTLIHSNYPELLPILGLTKPFAYDQQYWSYLGFKGGAEEGVYNLTIIGQTRNKPTWYVLTMTTNNATTRIDQGRFLELVERGIYLIENEHDQ